MSLPSLNDCCTPCDVESSVAVPGPAGPAGADGTNGTDGINAFTILSATFDMPGYGASDTATVVDNEWMDVGQVIWLRGGGFQGYVEVTAKGGTTSVTLKNLADGADAYPTNSAPGVTFPIGTSLQPGGLQGPAGSDASAGAPTTASYITKTDQTGTLTNSFPMSGLATGLVKNTTATGVPSIAAAGTDYLAPAAIGTTVQAYDAGLQSLSAFPTVADRIAYSTALNTWAETTLASFMRTMLAKTSILAVLDYLEAWAVNQGRICQHQVIDFNLANHDNSLPLVTGLGGANGYTIEAIVLYNCATSLTTATAGVFTAAGGGGTTLAADQPLTGITGSSKFIELALQSITTTDWRNESTLYFRTGTAQGAAATGTVVVFGKSLAG